MNIQSLLEKIRIFEKLVIESGFKRDIDGFIESINPQQNRQNLQLFQDISDKIRAYLISIYDSDLPEALEALLTTENVRPFTETPHLKNLDEIIENKELPADQYFQKLNQLLNSLKAQIEKNQAEIHKLKAIFQNYADYEKSELTSEDNAIISLIFKDLKTTTNLKEFSRALNKWNRTLLIYHQLLTSSTPEEIEIVEIQNGSIDVILNLNVDIAVDLIDLVKLGFQVFGGYLLYKKTAQPIIETYFGNKTLIKQEEQREKELLDNIHKAIENKISEQHKEAKKTDKDIDKTAIKVKAEEVARVLSEHIVKGNDIKLLAVPEDYEDLEEKGDELNVESIKNRKALKELPEIERIKLIEKYEIKETEVKTPKKTGNK